MKHEKPNTEPQPHAHIQRSYHRRQMERGLVRVSMYVPEVDRQLLIDMAKKMVDRRTKRR